MASNMSLFEWQDPFNLDIQLNEDERMVRDTARAYASDKLAPHDIHALIIGRAITGIPAFAN